MRAFFAFHSRLPHFVRSISSIGCRAEPWGSFWNNWARNQVARPRRLMREEGQIDKISWGVHFD